MFQTEAANYDKITGKKKYDMPKETLCTNINQFINKLIKYYKFLFNELKGISLIDSKSKNKKPTTLEDIVSNPETKMKETIDIFLDNVYDIFVNEGFFQEKTVISIDDSNEINNEKNENGNEMEEEKVLSAEEIAIKSIKNYIFKP